MSLTAVQIVRVATLRHDHHVLTNDERLRLIADAESSEELHHVVLGAPASMAEVSRLTATIKHPKCSQGTAFLVYWALDPGSLYWLLKKRKPLSKRSEDLWALVMTIEERVRAKQYTGEPIEFSFAGFLGRSLGEETRHNPGILSVPDFMRSDVTGARIE
jgi:hypothetical protein